MSIVTAILFNAPPPKFKGHVRTNYIDKAPPDRRNGGGGKYEVQRNDRAANTQRVLDAVLSGVDTANEIAVVADLSICTVRQALHRLEADKKVVSIPTGKKTQLVHWRPADHA